MPELPEVETVRRALEGGILGRRFARVELRRKDLRFPFPKGLAAALTGRRVVGVGRRAKYVLVNLDDGQVLVVHLGMSGRLRLTPPAEAPRLPPPGPHDHAIFVFDDGTDVRFNDARRFGSIDLVRQDRMAAYGAFRRLGPEPLGPDFDGPTLAARLRGKKTAIKAALLDQRVVAGLGNIYVCEALFQAAISPRRQAGTVAGERARRLAEAIRRVLDEAIAAGGSTLRDHISPNGEIGYFQHRFAVYDRAGRQCPGCTCGGAVVRLVQGGRSTFYCPARQR